MEGSLTELARYRGTGEESQCIKRGDKTDNFYEHC